MVVVRGSFLTRRVARFMWAWAEAAGVGMHIDVVVKIRWHLIILSLRQCYAVWDRRCSGGRESREIAALRLGTARAVGDRPRRTGIGGSAFAAIATSAKNAAPRTVDLQRVSI
jgi:hypothetical protein